MNNFRLRHIALLMLASLFWACPGPGNRKKQDNLALKRVNRFDFSGIRVVHMETAHPLLHFRVLVDGGASETEAGFAGIGELALGTALRGGAGDWNGKEFEAQLEAVGAALDHAITPDYGVITLECIPGNVEEAWNLLVSALMRPKFEKAAFEQLKGSRIAQLRTGAEQPGVLAGRLARQSAFEDSPYGIPPEGREATLELLDLLTVKDYFRLEMMQKCRLTLVVTGPISAEDVSDLMFNTLDGLPLGDCNRPAQELQAARTDRILAAQKTVPQQYMVGIIPGPGIQSDAILPLEFAYRILQKRLTDRLEKGERLAYQPQVDLVRNKQTYGLIRFASHRALMCAELTLSELRNMREGIPEKEIEWVRRQLMAELQRETETAEGLAQALERCSQYGTWPRFEVQAELVEEIAKKDLDKTVQKFFSGISWSYVGDTTRMDRKTLLRF